jgi:UDP-GlcNAc3NAcA epimerase
MTSCKIVTIVGARAQFIKAAAVTRVVGTTPGLAEIMVHTGQHFDADMSDRFFGELMIPAPKYNLAVGGGSHGEMTGRMLQKIEAILLTEHPDRVLVYGDTNSTLAGALAAAKLHIPVAHVEAGLRSYNRLMPEEINRVLADHISDLLLCPTVASIDNLAREGITKGVHHIGDVMFDVCCAATRFAPTRSSILADLGIARSGFSIATVHRAENTDDPERLAEILDFLKDEATRHPIVLPLHPRTRLAITRSGLDTQGLHTCAPVGYFDMAQLLDGCINVLTDSGGLQKEAYFFRRPCITLREETEWVETIEAGWNRLWRGPDYMPRRDIPDYGDGHAAEKVVGLVTAI